MGGLTSIGVVLFSLASSLIIEAVGWYIVYRKPDYQRLKRQVEKMAKELEKKRSESLLMDSERKREKSRREVGRLEKDVRDSAKELQTKATPSKIVVAFLVMGIMIGVNRMFAGHVVAKLPFMPYSLVQRISHRGLEGDDPTDCAMAFLFALCQVGVKGNIAKLLGLGQAKGIKEYNPLSDFSAQYDEMQAKIQ